MLIPLPIGMLTFAPAFDVAFLVTRNGFWAHCAYWMVACGIVAGLLAAIPGLIDWLAVPHHTRAKRIGLTHMGVNVSAILLYGASWAIRFTSDPPRDGAAAFVLALVGWCVLFVGGWLGGELVERLAVGVDQRAHLDAPSSIEEAPARRPPVPQYPLERLDPRSI